MSNRFEKFFRPGEVPELQTPGTRSVEAWFLGTKSENADEFERLIVEAIRDQAFWRRNFHPGDPGYISEQVKRQPEYLHAMDNLKDNYRSLLAFLKKSVPFFSLRYQGHMTWEQTMPAILGYFAAMLYNPNNVSFEASTATTILEILVGEDICRMLGYTFPDESDTEAIRPWGHITSGGTVANLEAIWAARNVKFYPIALKAALENEPSLAAAQAIEIQLPTGSSQRLLNLDTWQLLNLVSDDILALPTRLTKEYNISPTDITNALNKYSLQNLGIQDFSQQFLSGIPAPVFLVPATKHYSFPKAGTILGIGSNNVINVPVDADARQNIAELEKLLRKYLTERRPVYTVVSVMGSTEESAVDPLKQILELRNTLRQEGFEFTVHADAAWGGYHASLLRDDEFELTELRQVDTTPAPVVGLSKYVTEQFLALKDADSITVDPHKGGYIPYPAGALCYRNGAMRDLLTFKAPYIVHDEEEPTIGIYGVEGSKPGAAAAAVYLSHKVIRPTKSGYGQIHGKALFSCKKLYARLLGMAHPEDHFIVAPVPRLPAEISGGDAEAQIQFILEAIDRKTNGEILANQAAMDLLPEIGPDQNILTYAFNFKLPNGSVNTDLDKANRLNKAIYDILSINPGEDIYGYNLLVSTTDFDQEQYGEEFINNLKLRLGVAESSGTVITVLRSTVMDPWITETTKGSFLDVIESELRQAINKALLRDSLLQVFEDVDVDGDGTLSLSEVTAQFQVKGYTDEQINDFWKIANIDRDSTLTKSEFLDNFSRFLVLTTQQ